MSISRDRLLEALALLEQTFGLDEHTHALRKKVNAYAPADDPAPPPEGPPDS